MNKRNVRLLLEKVYKRFDDKKKWTSGKPAKDRNGNPVSTRSPNAVCWCLLGAMSAENVSGKTQEDAENHLETVAGLMFSRDFVSVNDVLGYAAVRRLLRKAIKELT